MDHNLISNKELIEMGYRPHTANDIIHQARELLVSRGYTFYNRKRLMVVPKSVVNEIPVFNLPRKFLPTVCPYLFIILWYSLARI